MVFIALPALQQAQRNTQRENDLSRFLTAVTDFQSNNNGNLPFTASVQWGVVDGVTNNFATRYIDSRCGNLTLNAATAGNCGDQFTDPDGTVYRFAAATGAPWADNAAVTLGAVNPPAFDHTIYVAVGYNCGPAEGTVRRGTGPRQIAMFMTLEGGGITCNDNQ